MRVALARHDTILRHAIESNGGHVFKTVGDAFCASFDIALDGLRAALDAQCSLAAEPWDVPGGIRVRMGLHVYTHRGDNLRLISARAATGRERKTYEEGI
jgi:uncharacterized DUF497 family protein